MMLCGANDGIRPGGRAGADTIIKRESSNGKFIVGGL